MNKTLTITASLAMLGATLPTSAGTGYEMRASTIDGSSATLVSSGYTLRATVGQTDAGTTTASTFRFDGGFWPMAGTDPSCNAADLSAPFGLLDLADITTFVQLFTAGDLGVDFDGSGLLDLADIVAFVNGFTGGCP